MHKESADWNYSYGLLFRRKSLQTGQRHKLYFALVTSQNNPGKPRDQSEAPGSKNRSHMKRAEILVASF